jgi:ParB-like nuclease family protein
MFELSTTGLPVIDAHADFARARRAHVVARTLAWLAAGRRRPCAPRTLADTAAMPQGAPRLEVIPLKAIVGSVEPSRSFDARFRPASDVVRARWERIALAHRKGISPPPITVRRCADGYYIVDGHHRVSVALALGDRDIEAWVTDTRSLARAPRARDHGHVAHATAARDLVEDASAGRCRGSHKRSRG